jgi:hypothetical protein
MRKFLTRKLTLAFAVVAVASLAVVGTAGAVITQPTVDVASYGDSLLTALGTQITAILPYAAAITAFAVGVGMLKRWLGHRKATSV